MGPQITKLLTLIISFFKLKYFFIYVTLMDRLIVELQNYSGYTILFIYFRCIYAKAHYRKGKILSFFFFLQSNNKISKSITIKYKTLFKTNVCRAKILSLSV